MAFKHINKAAEEENFEGRVSFYSILLFVRSSFFILLRR